MKELHIIRLYNIMRVYLLLRHSHHAPAREQRILQISIAYTDPDKNTQRNIMIMLLLCSSVYYMPLLVR